MTAGIHVRQPSMNLNAEQAEVRVLGAVEFRRLRASRELLRLPDRATGGPSPVAWIPQGGVD